MLERKADVGAVAAWFDVHKRAMPWRDNPTPYRVWLSEMMLQQTTVATVTAYFQRFIEAYPQLSDLARADEQSVLSLWAGLGYYNRARNLLKTAQIIGDEKKFPSSIKALLSLPGVGAYTAGAVASIAFGHPEPLVDTNVERVLGRFFACKREKNFEKNIRLKADTLVKEAFAKGVNPSVWNQAIMEIGALICTPKKTSCTACPLNKTCGAFIEGAVLSYPGDKVKAIITNIDENVLIEISKNTVILALNTGSRRKGLWDFPQGSEGRKIGKVIYRICNDRVTRKVFLIEDKGRCLLPNEKRFLTQGVLPPLTSPAAKILKNMVI